MSTSIGTTVAAQANGARSARSNALFYSANTLVGSTNNIYMADTDNQRVYCWLSGASAGTKVTDTGKKILLNYYLCV